MSLWKRISISGLFLVGFVLFIFKRFDRVDEKEAAQASATNRNDEYPSNLIVNRTEENGADVFSKALSTSLGMILCSDYKTVGLMFDLYANAWTENMQDKFTRGQSKLLRGEPAREPDLYAYGCALIPPATAMKQKAGEIVPVVSISLPNGTTIEGVTLPGMIASESEMEAANAGVEFQTDIDSLKGEFQKVFVQLPSETPNTRWIDVGEKSIAVIPYGPCMTAYEANNQFWLREVSTLQRFGPFQSIAAAKKSAEGTCLYYFKSMQQSPNMRMGKYTTNPSEAWFKPEAMLGSEEKGEDDDSLRTPKASTSEPF